MIRTWQWRPPASSAGSPGEKAPIVWQARAEAYFLLDDLAGMEYTVQRLLELEPKDSILLVIAAYVVVQHGDFAKVERLLDDYDEVKEKTEFHNMYVAVLGAMRQAEQMETPEFAAIVRRADAWFASRSRAEAHDRAIRIAHGEMLHAAGRYAEARQEGEWLLAEYLGDVRIRSLAATAAVRLGDLATAKSTHDWLRGLDQKYTFDYTLFTQAKIVALLGQPDDSLRRDPRFEECISPRG